MYYSIRPRPYGLCSGFTEVPEHKLFTVLERDDHNPVVIPGCSKFPFSPPILKKRAWFNQARSQIRLPQHETAQSGSNHRWLCLCIAGPNKIVNCIQTGNIAQSSLSFLSTNIRIILGLYSLVQILGLYWGYIEIMEKKMETTTV